MPEMEQQDKTLSEIIVKEAVERGMDSPLRETILEAVEESGGSRSGGRFPLAGALFGLGAAVGFLAGRQSEMEEMSLEEIAEPEIIESVRETAEEAAEAAEVDVDVEMESESESESESGSRLPKALLALGVLAGAAFLRRRLSSGEEAEEWEPIEEFEPATTGETDGETPAGTEGETGGQRDETGSQQGETETEE